MNPKTVVRGKPSQAYSNLRPLHASNTFQDPNPHVKTDEEIEMEAMKETIAEWKERGDGVSSEGRFKVFKKYNGRHHKPTPVTAQRKKYRRSVGINLGSDISDKSISKFIKSLDDDSTVQCKDFSGRTIPLRKICLTTIIAIAKTGATSQGLALARAFLLEEHQIFLQQV